MRTMWRSKGGLLGAGLLALEATGFLTQDAEQVGTTLVDSRNGLNKMSHLVILCTICNP